MFKSRKNRPEGREVFVANRTVIRIFFIAVAFVVMLLAIRQAQHALILIFTAFFLTLALNAPVHWVSRHLPGKRKGNRATATAVSFLIVIVFLFGFLALIIPPLIRQTSNFIQSAPHLAVQIRDPHSPIGKYIQRYNLEPQINKISTQISERLDNVGGAAITGVGRVGSSVFSVLTILVLTFMMLIEGPRWLAIFRDIIPDQHQARADRLARDMYRVVKGYINGQVVLALIAATMLLPALLILHISYPAALVVVVFICGLIPLVGHTIGAIIVTTVALFHSPWSAVLILAYYILYQQIENYIIQPRIQANSTNMSPLLVFSAVIVGVSFGGLLGGLVAIPVAGCIRIALLDWLHSRHILSEENFDEAINTPK